ncbi:MAG: nitronate monooxygenase, partial [Calditrichaeota bacterium]|nr:nitronate monooxygenase [Calditrichota bacterium]
GTRFIASAEAEVDQAYKDAIIGARSEDIVNTHRVDGFPGNFIYNPALQQVGLKDGIFETLASRSKRIKRWIALSRAARSLLAKPTHKISYKTVYSAGHSAGLIRDVQTVPEIMEHMIREYRAIVGKMPS